MSGNNKDKKNKNGNNKPVILRILILVICAALFLGATILPILSAK